jgi:signal-transduction protein with cAMP-binding, CBS, and nucleotidyltransferase domain
VIDTNEPDSIRVSDLEWPWLATVETDASVQEAANLMAEYDIGAVGVLHEGTLEGIISERDVVRACASGVPLRDIEVSQLMSRAPHVIPLSADVKDAAMTMSVTRVRHLPVVDGKTIVGMISARDLLDAFGGFVELRRSRLRATLWNRLSFNRPKVTRA